jgi:ankyrin repeat protein
VWGLSTRNCLYHASHYSGTYHGLCKHDIKGPHFIVSLSRHMDLESVLEELSDAAIHADGNRCKEILEEYHQEPGFLKECTSVLTCMMRHSGRFDYLGCVKVFLSYGVPIESERDPGQALHYAIQFGSSNEIMYLLLNDSQAIDVNRRFEGCTPIMTAVQGIGHRPEQDSQDQIIALLVRGADVHTVDEYGDSLLHQITAGERWLIKLLSDLRVDFDRKGRKGQTPLQNLLRTERDLVRRNNLHAGRTHFDFAELLILHGADINTIKDDSLKTAVQFAKENLPPGNRVRDLLESNESMKMVLQGFHPKNKGSFFHGLQECS